MGERPPTERGAFLVCRSIQRGRRENCYFSILKGRPKKKML